MLFIGRTESGEYRIMDDMEAKSGVALAGKSLTMKDLVWRFS